MVEPLDLAGYYMTPHLGIGQSLKLETIDRRLRELPLRAVLHLLAQVAYRADRAVRDRALQAELIRQFLPVPLVDRALEGLARDPNLVPLSSQVVLNLATRALANCPDSNPTSVDSQRLARQLGGLLLGLAAHTSRGDHERESLLVELARLDLFFRLNDASGWFDVANDLLFDVLPTMTSDRDWVDANAVMQDAYGMDLELFWSLTVSFGVAAQHNADGFEVPGNFDSLNVTTADVAAWMRAWSVDLALARCRAQEDLASGSWWSFGALYDRPILELEPGRGVVVRPSFLASKGGPTGMFWAVRNAYVDAGGSHGRWAQFFGRAIEALGRAYLDRYAASVPKLDDESAIRARWGEGRACDTVLLGDSWVAIDFVHHQITKATATTGNISNLMRDASMAAIDKLVIQIDETLRRGLAVETELPSRLYPVVVIGNPFPLNPAFVEEMMGLIAAKSPAVVGIDPRCRQPAILELHEFAALLRVAAEQGVRVSTLLEDWLTSPLGRNNFRNWFVTDGPGGPPRDADDTGGWRGRSLGRLLGTAQGAP